MKPVLMFLSPILVAALLAPLAQGETIIKSSRLMGSPLSVLHSSDAVESGVGLKMTTQTKVLGRSVNLLEASVAAIPDAQESATTETGSILGRTDLYVAGTRVWAGQLKFDKGTLSYTGGVAPTQIPFPIFAYPVGPLMIRVDAGILFEGDLVSALTPGPSYPLTDSTLDATLSANLAAAGFIEGYASLWLIRGGVGGALDLIEGTTGLNGHLYLNGFKPQLQALGKIHLLSGDVYAFVDTKLFFGKWNRILKRDFFKWNGWCYSFGAESCD